MNEEALIREINQLRDAIERAVDELPEARSETERRALRAFVYGCEDDMATLKRKLARLAAATDGRGRGVSAEPSPLQH